MIKKQALQPIHLCPFPTAPQPQQEVHSRVAVTKHLLNDWAYSLESEGYWMDNTRQNSLVPNIWAQELDCLGSSLLALPT